MTDSVSAVSFTEVLNWGKPAQSIYPNLAKLARRYLAIPATAAASESAFRYAGLTVTDLRNRLAPETVADLLFVYQ